jgi:hypothetical protein
MIDRTNVMRTMETSGYRAGSHTLRLSTAQYQALMRAALTAGYDVLNMSKLAGSQQVVATIELRRFVLDCAGVSAAEDEGE